MIWALLAWYFFGGASVFSGANLTSADVQAMSEQVASAIEDSERRTRAMRTLDRLEKDALAFEKAFAGSGERLNALYRDHADNRDEALAVLGELNAAWETGQRRALDARYELREELTEAEWSALFGGQ